VTFYAAIAPPILAGVVTPLWFHGLQASHLLVIPILGVALLRAHWAQRDQIALFESVDRNRARRKEAEEANRAKSAFMAAMTHELRTPLNAILNYAEMLEEDLAADGRQQLAADAVRIRRSGENLLSLVNAVLDYAMIEQGQLTPSPRAADIRALLEGEASALREAARARGNRIETCIAEGVGSFEVDADRLRQCVASLLSNACKFTQNGRITLRCNYEAGQLRIAVEDTGCGIGEEDAPKLFEPFSQADSGFTRASDGAGLGLAISRRLARLMGGDLVCRSAPGAGSVFTLTVAARELIRG
jgi:signal transduction histidine kinase